MNETIALMKRHRSVRQYEDEPIPAEHIRAAVEAGQAASTSSTIQAYCLIQVTDPDHRRQLVALTGGQEKVARAGAFFLICGDVRRLRLVAQRTGQPHHTRLEGFLLAVIDASLFAQNLALAFESLGYGICYIGGLRNHLEEADALLGLPEGVYPLYGLCVGVPTIAAMAAPRRPRLPVDAVLFHGRYPDDERMRALVDAYDQAYRAYLEARQAEPRTWSQAMAGQFTTPRRQEIAAYYRRKGADLT